MAAFNPQKISSTGDIITVDAGDSVVAKIDAASGLLTGVQTEDFSGASTGNVCFWRAFLNSLFIMISLFLLLFSLFFEIFIM